MGSSTANPLVPIRHRAWSLLCSRRVARWWNSRPAYVLARATTLHTSPGHAKSMRIFPGRLVNDGQSLSRIVDGTTHTIMLTEVKTRTNEPDSRGAWAGGFTGGSILALDMIPAKTTTDSSDRRGSPRYIPTPYPGVDPLPPNVGAHWSNEDYIRGCDSDTAVSQTEDMPCTRTKRQ